MKRIQRQKLLFTSIIGLFYTTPASFCRSLGNTMQETIDYMSARVAMSALVGATGGLTLATLRGHHFPTRTVGLTALSCAASAAACFGMERAANAVLSSREQPVRRFASHAIGGLLGGSLLGFLFIRKPVRGALFFTPIMLAVAVVDAKVAATKQGKLTEIQQFREEENSMDRLTED